MSATDAARHWRALFLAPWDASSESLLDDLLASGAIASVDALLDGKSITPLIGACIADNPGLVRRLAELGSDPDLADDGGWSPLAWCCKSNRIACTNALLDAGADPNRTHPKEGWSCLHFCSQFGSLGCASLLVDRGADIGRPDPATGAPAWGLAARDADLSLALGGSPSALDGGGRSCLHWAAQRARSDPEAVAACSRWMGLGAHPALADLLGSTPGDIALRRGLVDCYALLESEIERASLELAASLHHPQKNYRQESRRL